MAIRTFYWDGAESGYRATLRRAIAGVNRGGLRIGNAGDLFNRDLVRFLYGQDAQNASEGGKRLLLVGSVAHRVAPGDVVAGVGTKGSPLPSPAVETSVVGVRGPITLEAFRAAGYDTSDVRFMLDPGLLAPEVYPEASALEAIRGRVVFIPHYRDLAQFRSSKTLQIVSADAEPADFVREIALSEYVYSSSLHGVIFAHAMGRPCTLVAPRNPEPEIKYRDYFASLDLPWKAPVDIDDALGAAKSDVLDRVPNKTTDFVFPSRAELERRGILVDRGIQ